MATTTALKAIAAAKTATTTSAQTGLGAKLDFLPASAANVWSNPTWDLGLLLLLFAISFFYGLSTGKRKAVIAIIYTYVAFAVTSAIPIGQLSRLTQAGNEVFVKIGVFVVVFMLLLLLLGRTGGRNRSRGGFARPSAWWQIFLLSFAQVGLFTHILFGFLAPEKAALLAPITKSVFANPDLHIWWFAGPLVLLILLSKISSRED